MAKPPPKALFDERVDEFGASMFGAMGYDKSALPDNLVKTYNDFKVCKDKLQPGRLSAEGFATICLLADMKPEAPKK